MNRRLHKATAFITRGEGVNSQLLFFNHPIAGVQLPAGTVDVDELPETAVMREAWEETGLQNLSIAGKLGEIAHELPPNRRWIVRTTKLFDAPAFDANGLEFGLLRGAQVVHLKDAGDFAHVAYEEFDFNCQPPRLLTRQAGYVRRSSLTRRSCRHLYHLPTHSPTDDEWTIRADGHLFRCFWHPLFPKPTILIPPQQPWLEAAYPALIRSFS